MATTYRLASSSLVHTPGLVAWATNACLFEDYRPGIMKIMTETYPGVPQTAMEQLLIKRVPFTIEGETLVFTVEDN
ncbi:hypothetical protein [Paracoccus zhejiangensis]|uniref:Uncharacterized protein n=1 Tax=Paracoccus zhejiangensis TaxID=1077935 RepID=A0A2H5F5W8_9RHOB|nr:hypothetical protein [Paracoccus zhejiangensis]AUH66927.1 hypothetical protein CX676_21735 [Paracoccus zhejiangensis]